MNEPLCGWQWHQKHRSDYTQAEIDSLGIELRVNGKLQVKTQAGQKEARGIVREIVKLNKGGSV